VQAEARSWSRVITALSLAAILLSGCLSENTGPFLVPGLGATARTIQPGVLYSCEHPWGLGSHVCLSPTAPPRSEVIAQIPVGTELSDMSSLYFNGVDTAYCMLRARLAGRSDSIYVYDFYIEYLLGLPVHPETPNWDCSGPIRPHPREPLRPE